MLINDWMKEKTWSPWVAGVVLGIAGIGTYVLADKTIGSSGGLESIDSILGHTFHLPWANSMYFRFQMPPVISFQIMLFVGMLIGSAVSSLWSGDFKFRIMPDKLWTSNFGPSVAKRWILIFIGGAIIEFGAGVAGGCTSGLAISGSMQLSPAGFIFIAGLFITGIITTKILYGRNY
ncbi:MAG: YeeE/YedE thiosulfate transporter family protein [Peptococcaceae bacterium]|nr:YeeE/YedE thiosulfate transporter family protein [Peptococcaceae bacterium]